MVPKVRSPSKKSLSPRRLTQSRSTMNEMINTRSLSPSKKPRNKINKYIYFVAIALVIAIRSFLRFESLTREDSGSDEIENRKKPAFIESEKLKKIEVTTPINPSKSKDTFEADENKKKNNNKKTDVDEKKVKSDVKALSKEENALAADKKKKGNNNDSTKTDVNEKKVKSDVKALPKVESSFDESITLKESKKVKKDPKPDLAWLMSFPNSGTSFTLRVVRRASQRTTGTNYGREKMYSGSSIPYHPKAKNGPFVHVLNFEVPEKFLLTKTHCGGFCSTCAPEKYIMSKDSFEEWCLTGKSLSEEGEFKDISYNIDMVKKVLYLIRNPFDNIVSRFHLIHNEQAHLESEGNTKAKKWLETHPRDKEGFHEWCRESEQFDVEELTYVPEVASFPNVACRSEFIKYIQWHNHASEIVKSYDFPSLTVYYEDYDSKYDESIDSILNFLELEKTGEMKDFKLSDYSQYYSKEQRNQSIQLMKKLASDQTLKNIKRYFNSKAPDDEALLTKKLRG